MSFRIPNRNANHQLLVTVIAPNGRKYEEVECKLFLPTNEKERPRFYILPPIEPFKVGMYGDFWKFNLFGVEERYFPKLEISSETVFLNSVGKTDWSENQPVWIGIPADLKIKYHHEGGTKSKCAFWITPNQILTPAYHEERSVTGDRRIKQFGPKRTYKLSNGLRLTFKVHFKYQNSKNRKHESSQLVAEANISKVEGGTSGINVRMLREIDDFLLVSALASRQSCICTGWEGFDPTGSVTFYRGDKSIPKRKKNGYLFELIDYKHQRQFIEQIYPSFVQNVSIEYARKVIHALLVTEGVLEDISLRLFSCLETLVLAFRRESGLEFIISDDDERERWKSLRNGPLKSWIRRQTVFKGEANSTRRRLLYDNLAALDRVSFSHAFKAFCTKYQVDLSDLWPIAGGKNNLWTLTTIRNKLAHGESIGSHKVPALGTSIEHLRWTVERMLLGYLGWEIEKSNVSSEVLAKHYPSYRNWNDLRKQISEEIPT